MSTLPRILLVGISVVVLMLAACDATPKEWRTPNMTKLTPRLESIFEKTKTVCFGRFLVDVPASATVAWGEADVPLGVAVYPGGAEEVEASAQKMIGELKSEKAIYLNKIPLLISIDDVLQPDGKIVAGYDGFEAIAELKISGFFKWNNDAFIVDARPLLNRKDEVVADIKSIARRLRQHSDGDIPTDPGNCIESAFLPDDPSDDPAHLGELIRIGFRLKEFPDTHLSIFVRPSNPNYSESDSLKWQLERLEKKQKDEDPNDPNLKTKYFRRGERQIHDWVNGFEALSRTPELPEAHSFHSFGMDFRGVPSDPLKPYFDIRMETGVADDVAGVTKPSFTDEEAIAVWDKITSTIRVRPTKKPSAKTGQAHQNSRSPLGELAATGRICPESGWWLSEEAWDRKDGQRRYVKAGEMMPRAMVSSELSLWQKLRGDQPIYWTATMWKLVAYEESPGHVDVNMVQGDQNNGAKPKNEG